MCPQQRGEQSMESLAHSLKSWAKGLRSWLVTSTLLWHSRQLHLWAAYLIPREPIIFLDSIAYYTNPDLFSFISLQALGLSTDGVTHVHLIAVGALDHPYLVIHIPGWVSPSSGLLPNWVLVLCSAWNPLDNSRPCECSSTQLWCDLWRKQQDCNIP